jgi:hypothetical protein
MLHFHLVKHCTRKISLTGQSDKGVHDNTDDSSDDDFIPTPFAHQGMSKEGQLMCGINRNIHHFCCDMTGKKQNVALQKN